MLSIDDALAPEAESELITGPNYPSCSYTHVWLRILGEGLDPDDVSSLLGIQPSHVQLASRSGAPKKRVPGWFLESAEHVSSLDSRDHVQWLLDQVGGKGDCFAKFVRRGHLVDICCRWDSSGGDGGPTMDPQQMTKLGSLGVDSWFDIYFNRGEASNTSPSG